MPLDASSTSNKFKYISALLAFFMWGGWAFYLNDGLGLKTRLISGFTQAIASLMITLVMVNLVTVFFNYLPDNKWRFILPAMLTVGLTGSLLVCLHTIVGTPRTASTVAPALTVAFAFSVFTALKLKRSTNGEED